MTKGYLQKKDIDNCESFAPPVSERVYMKAVPGYPLEDDECLELNYIIYGLKQSPRAYYVLCQRVYTEIGLTQPNCPVIRQWWKEPVRC